MNRQNPFNQPSQETSEKSEAKIMSLEELKAAQDRKDVEAQHQKELEARTEAAIKTRESALAELKMSQAEIDKLRAARIEEKIAHSEKLKESQAAKAAELQKTQDDFNQIENQLAEIQALTEGRGEKDIAEEVKAVLKQVQQKKTALSSALQGLTQELGTMKAEPVSDVQIQRYQELLKKMEELNAQVADIEANPHVIERLFAGAKGENEMRDIVVREAVGGVLRQPKETEIVSQVVQRFLTEEFEIRGFDEIKDPKEREKAMREFAQVVASTVGGEEAYGPPLYSLKKDERVGILLKNLVGKYSNMINTEGLFGIASGGREFYDSRPQNDKVVGDYIRQHLGTINYLRANSSGLKTYQDAILGHRFGQYNRKSFDQNMYRYRLSAYEGDAIVPFDADENTKNEMQAEFRKNMKKVQDWEKTVIEEEKEELSAEIYKAEIKVQRIKNILSDAQRAHEFTLQAQSENIYTANEAQRRLAEINGAIANLESRRTKAEAELNKLGALSFGRKKKLRNEISGIDYELTGRGYSGKREQKKYLDKLVKAYETETPFIKTETALIKIENELREAQQNLKDKKNRLAFLNKALGAK